MAKHALSALMSINYDETYLRLYWREKFCMALLKKDRTDLHLVVFYFCLSFLISAQLRYLLY